jgi:hypothetical protein
MRPEAIQATGVNAPTQSRITGTNKTAETQNGKAGVKLSTELRTSINAAQKRSMRRPTPAAPAGNMENSLCNRRTLVRPQSSHNLERTNGK